MRGRQDLGAGELTYGQSITDGCLDWDTTVEVLDGLADLVGQLGQLGVDPLLEPRQVVVA